MAFIVNRFYFKGGSIYRCFLSTVLIILIAICYVIIAYRFGSYFLLEIEPHIPYWLFLSHQNMISLTVYFGATFLPVWLITSF